MSSALRSVSNKLKSRPVMLYTLFFIIISILLFGSFYLLGLTFIYKGDGYDLYIRELIYFSDYIKEMLSTLVRSHSLSIQEWTHSVGEGTCTISALSADPLFLLSIFFNHSNMHICYDLIQLVRMFLCGLVFLFYCRETFPPASSLRLLCCSLMYAFSQWNLSEITYDSFFINLPFFLIFMLYGVERVLHHKNPAVYILSILLSSADSVYLFFMVGLSAALYCISRLIFMYRKNFRSYIAPVVNLAIATVLGFLLAAVSILPRAYLLLVNPRTGATVGKYDNFYRLSFFESQPSEFLMLMPAISLITLFMIFFIKGKYRLIKVSIIILFLMTLTPVSGSIFNGFNYSSTRWYFIFSFVFACMVFVSWDDLISGLNGSTLKIAICMTVYFIICVAIKGSRSELTFIYFAIAALLLIFLNFSKEKNREHILLFFCILGILINNSYLRSDEYDSMMRKSTLYNSLYYNDAYAIDALKASTGPDATDPLQRYSGSDLSINSGWLRNLSSSSFYRSQISPYTNAFRRNLALFQPRVHIYHNYDERTVANAISAIKYYISNSERIPFGFSFTGSLNVNEEYENRKLEELKAELGVSELTEKQINSIKSETEDYEYVFKNDYPLPLGFTYDSYIPYDSYLKMSAPNREWSMLDGVVLDDFDDPDSVCPDLSKYLNDETLVASRISEIDPQITPRGDHTYIAPEGGGLTLEFDSKPHTELYLYLEGISFRETGKYTLYFGDDEVCDPQHAFNRTNFDFLTIEEKQDILKEHFTKQPKREVDIYVTTPDERKSSVKYKSDYSMDYEDKQNYVVNLGYRDEQIDSVYLNISKAGILSIDSIRIYALSMDDYPEKIARLREDYLENIKIDGDIITGNINLDRPKFLYLSVPYSPGWSAIDNGEAVRIYRANDMYMAIPLKEGSHDIRFEFKTPLLRTGACVSLAGVLILIIYILFTRIRGRKKT